jgi:uncharacterized protein YkwD
MPNPHESSSRTSTRRPQFLPLLRKKSLWSVGIALLMVALVLSMRVNATGVSASGDCTVSNADLAQSVEEVAFLTLLNNYRAQNGLVAVAKSPTLTKAASWKSRDMYANHYLSHTDSLGRGAYILTADCGYPYWNLVNVGEIAAAGFYSANSVFEAWKASDGHNRLMLWPDFRAVGIGNTAGYWSVIFGERLDASSSLPTATATPAPTSTPSAGTDTSPPAVLLVNPPVGSVLTSQATLKATASDDVGVAKVSFYVDGALIKTITSAPYEVTWNTRKLKAGSHTVSAVAVDGAGNRSTDSHVVTK